MKSVAAFALVLVSGCSLHVDLTSWASAAKDPLACLDRQRTEDEVLAAAKADHLPRIGLCSDEQTYPTVTPERAAWYRAMCDELARLNAQCPDGSGDSVGAAGAAGSSG